MQHFFKAIGFEPYAFERFQPDGAKVGRYNPKFDQIYADSKKYVNYKDPRDEINRTDPYFIPAKYPKCTFNGK